MLKKSENSIDFENKYYNLSDLRLKIDDVLKKTVDIDDHWHTKLINNTEINQLLINSKNEFEFLKPKIKRNKTKCVFIGETSSGKSSLLNAILCQCDLPCKTGRVTNCFTKIQRSHENQSYAERDKEKLELTSLKDLISAKTINNLSHGSCVKIFYTAEDCKIFENWNITLVDTPGIYKDDEIDKAIVEECKKADFIVIVINAEIGVNTTMTRFFNQFKTEFLKFNYFVVFNHWDRCEVEDDCEDSKIQLLKEAEQLFPQNFRFSFISERIFFISAKEQISINSNNSLETNGWVKSGDNFRNFLQQLKREMNNNVIKSKHRCLDILTDVVKDCIKFCEDPITKMKERIPGLSVNFLKKVIGVKDLDTEITESVTAILTSAYDEFIEGSLKKISDNFTREEEEEIFNRPNRNPRAPLSDEEKTRLHLKRIEELRFQICNKSKENLQSKIIEIIQQHGDIYLLDLKLIIEKLFFPVYVNQIALPEIPDLINILKKIKTEIQVNKLKSIGKSIVIGAVGLGICGAALPFVVARFGLIGMSLGATIGAGTSIKGMIKNSYKDCWKKYEEPIFDAWQSYTQKLSECYPAFVCDLTAFIDIQCQLNYINEKMALIK